MLQDHSTRPGPADLAAVQGSEDRKLAPVTALGLGCLYAASYMFPLLGKTGVYLLPSIAAYVFWPGAVAAVSVTVVLLSISRALGRYRHTRVYRGLFSLGAALVTLLAVKSCLDAADLSWMGIVGRLAGGTHDTLAATRGWQVALTVGAFIAALLAARLFRAHLRSWLAFFSVLGYTLVGLAVFRAASYAELPGSVAAAPSAIRAEHPRDGDEQARERRVVWVIFDELDYNLALGATHWQERLPRFAELTSKAVRAEHAYPPARDTLHSIPALLMGIPISGGAVSERGTLQLTPLRGPRAVSFGLGGSVFAKLPAGPGSAAILGYYLPYCREFAIGACSDAFLGNVGRWFDGLTFFAQAVFSAGRWVEGFVEFVPDAAWQAFDPMYRVTAQIVAGLPEILQARDQSLAFIHVPLPHVPGAYAQKVFDLPQTADDRQSYFQNMVAADWLLGRIMDTLAERAHLEDTLLIVSSDHWFRLVSPFEAQPIPFLAWKVGETQGVPVTQRINTVHTSALVLDFLRSGVTSQAEIARWWRDKAADPTLIPDEPPP